MDLNSSNVFLKHEDEKKYLEKNNITYKKLGNNSTIIGFPHDVKDTNDSFIQFIFNSGSFNDPLGKKGLHHLYEHLILNRIHKNPKSVDVYKNGSTTHRCLKIDIQGVSNPNVKEYGIYPIIPDVISILKNPLDTITKDNIESEVKIVLQEMAERKTNPNYNMQKFMYECIYSKNNPLTADTLGLEAELRTVSIFDLAKISENVFVPSNLSLRVISEGETLLAQKVLDVLIPHLLTFPRKDVKPLTVDIEREEELNPEFKPGSIFEKDDGLKNGLKNVAFVWVVPAIDFTSYSFTISRLIPHLNSNLLYFSRENGIGYSSYATNYTHKKYQIVLFSLTLSKKWDLDKIKQKLLPSLKKSVFSELNEVIIAQIAQKEKLIQKAVPMSPKNRYSIFTLGIDYYNRIIDADLVKKEYEKITVNDIKEWKERLLGFNPSIIISGDLTAS